MPLEWWEKPAEIVAVWSGNSPTYFMPVEGGWSEAHMPSGGGKPSHTQGVVFTSAELLDKLKGMIGPG
jgi:hypothetical protein